MNGSRAIRSIPSIARTIGFKILGTWLYLSMKCSALGTKVSIAALLHRRRSKTQPWVAYQQEWKETEKVRQRKQKKREEGHGGTSTRNPRLEDPITQDRRIIESGRNKVKTTKKKGGRGKVPLWSPKWTTELPTHPPPNRPWAREITFVIARPIEGHFWTLFSPWPVSRRTW